MTGSPLPAEGKFLDAHAGLQDGIRPAVARASYGAHFDGPPTVPEAARRTVLVWTE